MFKKISLFIVFTFILTCNRDGSKADKEREAQLILNYLRNSNTSNPVQSACFQFTAAESTCIVSPDESSISCSTSEYDRLKLNITVADKRTDPILIAFFNCWKACNIIYNANDNLCAGSKYTSTNTYREKMKSGSTAASISWGACMQKCNNGSSDEAGLKGTGAIYTGQPY
jgi:hypothetical protein